MIVYFAVFAVGTLYILRLMASRRRASETRAGAPSPDAGSRRDRRPAAGRRCDGEAGA